MFYVWKRVLLCIYIECKEICVDMENIVFVCVKCFNNKYCNEYMENDLL